MRNSGGWNAVVGNSRRKLMVTRMKETGQITVPADIRESPRLLKGFLLY
jgi:hypothetical protein